MGWYRENGTVAAPLSKQLLPEYTVWVSLHGGNGKWAQQKAVESWERQLQERSERQRAIADCDARRLAREAEIERRRKDEETYRRLARNTLSEITQRREEAERRIREEASEAR